MLYELSYLEVSSGSLICQQSHRPTPNGVRGGVVTHPKTPSHCPYDCFRMPPPLYETLVYSRHSFCYIVRGNRHNVYVNVESIFIIEERS